MTTVREFTPQENENFAALWRESRANGKDSLEDFSALREQFIRERRIYGSMTTYRFEK